MAVKSSNQALPHNCPPSPDLSFSLQSSIQRWLEENPLSASDMDCATAVMLKILDGKCKMAEQEKLVMTALYDAARNHPGQVLGADIHPLIDKARQQLSDEMKDFIYEKRVLAETMISRPVMKNFKRWIREQGLFVAEIYAQPD